MTRDNSQTPLLSVIVPVYKTERYLDACIETVLGQTLKDLELILVDDGSPDRCPEMCEQWARRDPRIRVVHKENQGLGYARNTGLDYAKGKYVAFLDSDDLLEPQTYAVAIEEMERHDAQTVRFACNRFDDQGHRGPETYDDAPVLFDRPEQIRSLALCIFDIPSTALKEYDLGGSSCMAVYRRDLIMDNGVRFENEREYLSEDYLFNLDYYGLTRRVVWLPRTYYHYRITAGSLTRGVDLKVMERVEKYSRHLEEVLAERGYADEARQYAAGFYVRALRANMKFVFISKALNMADKRRWFHERVADPYFRDICATYRWEQLPLKQRILYHTTLKGHFLTTFSLIVGFSKLRRDKMK
ncbi:MAG: glycosyltransferase [Muribaculaceae bacterium]|nr:glycosyltransferase [Muribaculaceae bacterium]